MMFPMAPTSKEIGQVLTDMRQTSALDWKETVLIVEKTLGILLKQLLLI